ncbi:FAD-dependent monooxygenase [Streptomyces sp. M19]
MVVRQRPRPRAVRAELAAVDQETWRERSRSCSPGTTPRRRHRALHGRDDRRQQRVRHRLHPTWSDDEMVIVGDAAHASSPHAAQGASMAIEDGWSSPSACAICGCRGPRSPRTRAAPRTRRAGRGHQRGAGPPHRAGPGQAGAARRDDAPAPGAGPHRPPRR